MQGVAYELIRRLEGADEDDDMFQDDGNGYPWYSLDHWVERDSLGYDIIEGFFLVAIGLACLWMCWGCLVVCRICPDDRLDRRRYLRKVRDGRGVFAPVRLHDPNDDGGGGVDDDDEDDDDASRESMEYGNNHLDDYKFRKINVGEEEKKLMAAAQDFFDKPRRGNIETRSQPDEETVEDTLLDLEMIEQPRAQQPLINFV